MPEPLPPVRGIFAPVSLPEGTTPMRSLEELMAKRDRAEERARQLLLSMLTERQRSDMADRSGFFVEGSAGFRYFIRTTCRTGNVHWVDWRGKPRGTLCAGPDNVPNYDVFLAQKLALETDERAFLRVAYIDEYPTPPWY